MQDLLRELETDHEAEGKRFQTLSIVTNQYKNPSNGCHTFEVTYGALVDFGKISTGIFTWETTFCSQKLIT